MDLTVRKLSEVKIYSFYSNISLELPPRLTGAEAIYTSGSVEALAYESVSLQLSEDSEEVKLGATYYCAGTDENGDLVQTHWMYCTQVSPLLLMGIARNHRRPGVTAPAPNLKNSLFVQLEPLRDIVGITSHSCASFGMAEYRLSDEGSLISTGFGVPHAMGIQIEEPSLPLHYITGSRNLTIVAKSKKTSQTIGLTRLICVQASSPAIYLQEEAQ